LNTGPWASCVVKTNGVAIKTVTQEKWVKTKTYLSELQSRIGSKDYPAPLELK